MDTGRAFVGASTIGALVLAVGFGVAVAPSGRLTTNTIAGGVCATFPAGSSTASEWFLVEMQNHSGTGVHVRDVRALEVRDVTLEHLAIAPEPSEHASGLIATDDPGLPDEYGTTIPIDSGYVVPAHGELDVVGRMVLRDGAAAGQVRGFAVTSVGPVGTLRTDTTPESFGVGIDQGDEDAGTDCFAS